MIRKMLLAALVLVGLFAAPAAAQYPGFQVNPGTSRPGGPANFNGKGCQPGETVTIRFDGTVGATVTAKPNGSFNGQFRVPTTATPGTHTVTATCGNLVQSAPLDVRGSEVTRPNTGSGSLPRTGTDVDMLGLVGAGLLAAGGSVMLATRKRRAA